MVPLNCVQLSPALAPGALDGVEVILGDTFQSCDQVCSNKGRACSPQHMPLINSCDRLRELVACEAGCEPRKKGDSGAPGYVDPGSAKGARPAMCFVHRHTANMTCAGTESSLKRMCACKSK